MAPGARLTPMPPHLTRRRFFEPPHCRSAHSDTSAWMGSPRSVILSVTFAVRPRSSSSEPRSSSSLSLVLLATAPPPVGSLGSCSHRTMLAYELPYLCREATGLVGVEAEAIGVPILVSGDIQTFSDALLIGPLIQTRNRCQVARSDELLTQEKIHEG